MFSPKSKKYRDFAVQTWNDSSLTTYGCKGPLETPFSRKLCTQATLNIAQEDPAQVSSKFGSTHSAYNDLVSSLLDNTWVVDEIVPPGRKYTGLDRRRPGRTGTTEGRVVSLPCTSKAGLTRDNQPRTVSMPEQLVSSTSRNSMPSEICSSSHLETSSESSSLSYDSVAARARHFDFPRTPSPSSNDSLNTGNGAYTTNSSSRQPYMDEDGWVSWMSSPPRPIPALHGPSSLPYARCPSGAEGTLIEGDNLSYKIWGLNQGEATASSLPHHLRPSGQHAKTIHEPEGDMPSGVVDCGRYNENPTPFHWSSTEDVIDISSYRNGHRHNEHLTSDLKPSSRAGYSEYNTSPIDLACISAWPLNTGLGLNWLDNHPQSADKMRIPHCGSRPLNSLAPIFVPTETKYAHCVAQDANQPRYLNTESTPTTVRISCGRPDSKVGVHTPSTTSTTWSPLLYSSNLSEGPEIAKEAQIASLEYNSDLYSPTFEIAGRPTLQSVIQEIRVPKSNIDIPSSAVIDPGSFQEDLRCRKDNGADAGLQFAEQSKNFGEPLLIDFDDPAEDLAMSRFLRSQRLFQDVNLSERRRSFSHQVPRSIPLARLIQRRLSSVAEENAADNFVPNMALKLLPTTTAYLEGDKPDANKKLGTKAGSSRIRRTRESEDVVTIRDTTSIELPMEIFTSSTIVKLPGRKNLGIRNQRRRGI